MKAQLEDFEAYLKDYKTDLRNSEECYNGISFLQWLKFEEGLSDKDVLSLLDNKPEGRA